MRHRATKAAPSAESATAFSKYFSPKEKEKYERKKSGSETSLELAAPRRAKSARLGNLSCPPKAGEPKAGHLFFGQGDHSNSSNVHNNLHDQMSSPSINNESNHFSNVENFVDSSDSSYENPLKSVQKMDEISCESSEEESFHISKFSSKNCKIVAKDQESFQESSDECFEQSREKVEISSIEKSFQLSSVKEKKYQSSMKLKFSFLDSSDCDSEISKEKVEKFDMSDLDKYMVPISLNKCRKCNFLKYPSSNGVHLCGFAGCEILNRFIENTSELYCTQCKILFTVGNSIQNASDINY